MKREPNEASGFNPLLMGPSDKKTAAGERLMTQLKPCNAHPLLWPNISDGLPDVGMSDLVFAMIEKTNQMEKDGASHDEVTQYLLDKLGQAVSRVTAELKR